MSYSNTTTRCEAIFPRDAAATPAASESHTPQTLRPVGIVASELADGMTALAQYKRWHITPARRLGDVLRFTHKIDLRVLVFLLAHADDAALGFLAPLHDRRPNLSLLAAACHHSDELEAAVRGAGVNIYLPSADPFELCDAVGELLGHDAADASLTGPRFSLFSPRRA